MKKKTKVLLCSALFLLLLLTYMHVESRWLQKTYVTIVDSDIPAGFDGKRIVFVSDIHHGPFFSKERVRSLVGEINALHPDMVLLGGDYVHHDQKYIQPVFSELQYLKAPLGIYAVLGNHDHWESAALTRVNILQNGFHLCDNESYWVHCNGDSILIGGVGDLWEDKQCIERTTKEVKPENFCLLLSHNPDFNETADSTLIDLVLSGHTHGGQVTFFGLWAPLLPSSYGQKYRYGLHGKGDMQYYITAGVGTITPPLRFFCPPEIVVLELSRIKK